MDPTYHQIIGRYALFDEIASGGMATVHIGRLLGPVGFSRTVAIKRLHPQFAKDPEFVSMFVDEARLAARIRHPNVVPTLDVVKTDKELFLVMEYVQGESLSRLMRRARRLGQPLDSRLVVPVVAGVLHGLHAAHNAKDERGQALHIVHRDVSPQNVLVGTDGAARVFDFGIAKARGRLQTTREGQIKGKLAYMAPEQLQGEDVGPTTDVYSAAVVLWEALAGRRLFDGENEAVLLGQVLGGVKFPPSEFNPKLPQEIDQIVMMALRSDPDARFASARAMAVALERSVPCASATEIGEWVEDVATETLQKRADRIAEIESQSELHAFDRDATSPSTPRHDARSSVTNEASVNSQLSSISVARTHGGLKRQGPRIGAAVVAGLAAIVIGGVLAVVVFGGGDGGETTPAASAPALDPASDGALDPAEPPVAGEAASAAATAASSAPSTGPPDDATAAAAGSASAADKAAKPPVIAPRPRPRPPPPRRSPPPSSCNPPYTVDKDGIQIPKPHCL